MIHANPEAVGSTISQPSARLVAKPAPERPELDALIEQAKQLPPMTEAQRDEQARSWVRGEMAMNEPVAVSPPSARETALLARIGELERERDEALAKAERFGAMYTRAAELRDADQDKAAARIAALEAIGDDEADAKLAAAEADRDALQAKVRELTEALAFYRDEWLQNATGDIEEAHLTRVFSEPTTALYDDAGQKARAALSAVGDRTESQPAVSQPEQEKPT